MKSLIVLVCLLAFSAHAQTVGPCQIFPSTDPWNTDISKYPIHPSSDAFVAKINSSRIALHPDFTSTVNGGIPYVVVGSSQALVSIVFTSYPSESDPGPYAIPANAPIEQPPGGDCHVLVVDTSNAMLYELYQGVKDASGTGWSAACGAKYDLTKTEYRPLGWTSCDAAGLPIFPGLVRYDEVASGEIKHAVRFTTNKTVRGFIHPARHYASALTDPTYPPMGLRMRLKSNFDLSTYTGQSKIILTALKKYGMILADNGSAWFITGAPDPRWDDNDLNQMKNVPGNAFEAVMTGKTYLNYNVDPVDGVAPEVIAGGVSLDPPSPNPACRTISATYIAPEGAKVEFGVLDMLGRTMVVKATSDENGRCSVDLSGLPNGSYILAMTTKDRICSRPFMVLR